MWEELTGVASYNPPEQKRDIEIITGNPDFLHKIGMQLELSYPGFFDKFAKAGLNVNVIPFVDDVERAGLKISSAPTNHSVLNDAYRFDNPQTGKSFAISGDGAFSDESRQLYQGVNLLIHEGFEVSGEAFGGKHASIEQVVEYAIQHQISTVAITHVHRTE